MVEQELEFERAYNFRINICCSSSCASLNAPKLLKAFQDAVKELGVEKQCKVARTGCIGACSAGPTVLIEPGAYLYQNITPDKVHNIVRDHIVMGSPVKEMLYESGGFFKKQHRIVLRNAGKIDPNRIQDYIAMGGYTALVKCLSSMTPPGIITEILSSGLRGRGGAGFPTGQKWRLVAQANNSPKYIVANLDEGDPGVYANRSIAEADPHAIIEGMLIAAYATGAEKGYIYIRKEYPLAIQTLQKAIDQAKAMSLLGDNILETPLKFDLTLRFGAGAFVAGEETAILASVEGRRAMPRPRPPYPANSGLWQKPTLIQNIETLTNIPLIIQNSAAWFSKTGTPKCTGTKCFSLTGKVKNPGLIEVPMGITLREVVFDIGGGIPDGKKFKAALIGGPSGGCLPEHLLEVPIDYDSLTKVGAIMGSGGIVVLDQDSCMVDTARYFTEFCVDESCGRCTPCRAGLPRMLEIFQKITHGQGEFSDLAVLEKSCHFIREASLCGLGQTAPNPVLTTLRYFKSEYLHHIENKECEAGVCFKTRDEDEPK
ncbi:MAG: SLBB domain-containing protein [Nitrososphaerota archaeon]|uniref:NADH-ubiquinone oxidoreductase-F iron-sulfur binding region domain-containing protein n=1 Tax=Candidatus Bathycorpusculum sp. TaxID=2994959 RepID=UPI002838249C|nr:SLBB domain-containing protein [Candidatus Termitimicrobium sp.]MCL2431898.1 SLBB domain-containing protein [Candidatus Termitimicrobium sp.]MDR0492753.1 SLBB domain-containing protein [Nitrososphaerota archaeon]